MPLDKISNVFDISTFLTHETKATLEKAFENCYTSFAKKIRVSRYVDEKSFMGIDTIELNSEITKLENEINDKQIVSRILAPAIEEKIFEIASALTNFVYGDNEGSNAELSWQFYDILKYVEGKQRSIKELSEAQIVNSHEIQVLIIKTFDLIESLIENVCELLHEIKGVHCIEVNASFNQHYCSVLQNIHLKLECLKYEALLQVYDEPTVQALRTIRETYQMELISVQEKLNSIEHELDQYKILGDEFISLSTRYKSVLDQIAIIQDDLSRLSV
ncbi:hypothetical protein O9G_001569 [Rozella allomycis CSF55]|uniref:Uncharacterized protein n=1 Tax=Rozella allomycis (strain CSF55) TaxID=988480 RepID=A0A075B244_ROZAC|nr:hypothetical protein O9G_001569 [Rozella allomycis CSF55]|eukprot:EPZ36585.1 hypothetical protein O9G_001569 [Rozella allomycis CSF55]